MNSLSPLLIAVFGNITSIIVALIGAGVWSKRRIPGREHASPRLIFFLFLIGGIAITALFVGLRSVKASQPRIEQGLVAADLNAVKQDNDGRKSYSGSVTFNPAFSTPPKVAMTLQHIGINSGPCDIAIENEKPTISEFSYIFRVAKATDLSGAAASWIAIGKQY
jgi:H-type lectin domain